MFSQELRQLQQTLNKKADRVQSEFSATGDKLQDLARQIRNAPADDQAGLRQAQTALWDTQQALAGEVNLWRDRARQALQQADRESLNAYLDELAATEDEAVRVSVQRVRTAFDAPGDPGQASAGGTPPPLTTPAGRLIERARTEFDLRSDDPAPRQRTAFEFANRTGVAQDDAALLELEHSLDDPDQWVREVAALTVIQICRFRAKYLNQLAAVEAAVKRLGAFQNPAAIPALIEISSRALTGIEMGPAGPVTGDNRRSRQAALARLAEWHTRDAQAAVRACLRDRDPAIRQTAADILEQSPGEWS